MCLLLKQQPNKEANTVPFQSPTLTINNPPLTRSSCTFLFKSPLTFYSIITVSVLSENTDVYLKLYMK